MEATAIPHPAWVGLGIVLTVVLYLTPLIDPFPLLDPDEGLHATISSQMAKSGDIVTPRFRGWAFRDKPILFFWCQAASIAVLGDTVQAVRLPGLLFGWLGAVTTGVFAGRLFGRRAGLLASVFAMTTILPLALAQSAVHDVALVPFSNLALLSLWEMQRAELPRTRRRWILAAGVSLGLAALAKGLIGWAVVAVAIGLALILTRRLTVRTCLGGMTAVLLGALIAAPWYLLMERSNPGYLSYYFLERHVGGYVTDAQLHSHRKYWYYVPILLGGGIPWIGALPLAFRDFWRRFRDRAPTTGETSREASLPEWTLAWCWLIGGFAFLSLAHAKMFTYLSPVLPSLAVLAAVFYDRLFSSRVDGRVEQSAARSGLVQGLVMAVAVPVLLVVLHVRAAEWVSWTTVLAGLTLAILFAVPAVWTHRREWPRAVFGTAVLAAAAFLLATRLVLPGIASRYSSVDLVRWLEGLETVPQKVVVIEERVGSVHFYVDRSPRADVRPIAINFAEFDPPLPWNAAERGTAFAVPARLAGRFRQSIDVDRFAQTAVGHYQVFLRR